MIAIVICITIFVIIVSIEATFLFMYLRANDGGKSKYKAKLREKLSNQEKFLRNSFEVEIEENKKIFEKAMGDWERYCNKIELENKTLKEKLETIKSMDDAKPKEEIEIIEEK